MILRIGLPIAIEEDPVMEKINKIVTNCKGVLMFHRVINFFMIINLKLQI